MRGFPSYRLFLIAAIILLGGIYVINSPSVLARFLYEEGAEFRTVIPTAQPQPVSAPTPSSAPAPKPVYDEEQNIFRGIPLLSQSSCRDDCQPGDCWDNDNTRACLRNFDSDPCYDWSPKEPEKCVGDSQCVKGLGSCSYVPLGTEQYKGEAGKKSVDLLVGYGTGAGGNSKGITVTPFRPFYLHWQASTGNNAPKFCNAYGTGAFSYRIGWSGSLPVPSGDRGPFQFGPASGLASTFAGRHGFGVVCVWPDGKTSLQDEVSVILLEERPTQPQLNWVCPGVRQSCVTNECLYSQCWNINQTRPCVKDYNTGNSCWCEPIKTCDPGSHCLVGQCVDDKTGKIRYDPSTNTTDGTNGADSPKIDWDKLLKELNKTDTGTDNNGGTGGAGFPAFGSTQCYDGKDNDNDGKIDNGVTKVENGVKKYYPPDPGCQDKDGKYDPNDKFEFQYRIKEVIPDFFNLNWFRLDFSVVDITSAVI